MLALVVLGCGGCDRGEKAPSTRAPDGPTIKVLNAGKDPKRVLRVKAPKDEKQTVVMALDMGITLDMGGVPRTQTIPTISMPMDVTVNDVAANGDIRYTFVLREPSILADDVTPPAVIEAMKGATVGIAGLKGTAVVTNRGFTKDVHVTTPPGASPQIVQMVDSLEQSIGQMAAPVPEEAVGVGATWETTMNITKSSMKLTQVATTEIVAMEGDVVTLSIKLTQSAPKQKITTNGVTANLESYSGTGTGQTIVDLGHIVPKKAQVGLKSDMKMKAGEQSVSMGLTMDMTITAE